MWLASGPVFRWSDTWQLIINTLTNIVSMLMIFLIQNTQNRESAALQLKVDELLRSVRGAQNAFINLEELTEEDSCASRSDMQRWPSTPGQIGTSFGVWQAAG